MAKFLRNVWYLAAWTEELADQPFLARTIINEPLLFFRRQDQSLAALTDRCPHRFAPLSRGTLEGDNVVCGYHGLAFGPDGVCVHNPHGPIPAKARVRAYPAHERHEAIWVWMGEPEAADPATIPDLSFIERSPATAKSRGHMVAGANYQLLTDNILDLTHADYLHPTTLGGGSISRAKPQVSERDGGVEVKWYAVNEKAPPAQALQLPDPNQPADVWTEVFWTAPATMTLVTGLVPTGHERTSDVESWNAHVMTPETETTSHYFYCNTREFQRDDAAFNEWLKVALANAFNGEDKPMIEAQQARMGTPDLWALDPVLLIPDAAAVRARRRLDALIQAEAGAPAT